MKFLTEMFQGLKKVFNSKPRNDFEGGFSIYCRCEGRPDIAKNMIASKGNLWKFECPNCKKQSTFMMGAPVPIEVENF